MSRFHYTARGPHGPVQGVQEAASATAVADELRADDRSFEVDADDDVDRLARVAGRVDLLRVQERVADDRLAAHRGCDDRIGLHRAEAVGAGNDLRRRDLGEELVEPVRTRLRRCHQRNVQRNQQQGTRCNGSEHHDSCNVCRTRLRKWLAIRATIRSSVGRTERVRFAKCQDECIGGV